MKAATPRRFAVSFLPLFILLASARADVAQPPGETVDVSPEFRMPAEPEVRILLVSGAESLVLSSEDGFSLRGDGPDRLVPGPVRLLARKDTDGIRLGLEGAEGATSLFWVARPLGGTFRVGNRPYRGRAVFSPNAGGIGLVEVVALEEYLRGVVPLEIGPINDTTLEAVRAQAIAARTYALRGLGKHEAEGFDLYADVRDQAYGGVAVETHLADIAVLSTAGLAVVFEGHPAQTYYHSTCGGKTAAAAELWWGVDLPYLVSLEDRLGDTDACIGSKWYAWRRELSAADIARIFARAEGLGVPSRMELANRSPSGRVRRLRLVDRDWKDTRVEGELAIRRILGGETEILRSSVIEMDRSGETVVLTGRGAGHGVGMCQTGALGRARAGRSAEEILLFYYPGTKIQSAYEWTPAPGPPLVTDTRNPIQTQRGWREEHIEIHEETHEVEIDLTPIVIRPARPEEREQ